MKPSARMIKPEPAPLASVGRCPAPKSNGKKRGTGETGQPGAGMVVSIDTTLGTAAAAIFAIGLCSPLLSKRTGTVLDPGTTYGATADSPGVADRANSVIFSSAECNAQPPQKASASPSSTADSSMNRGRCGCSYCLLCNFRRVSTLLEPVPIACFRTGSRSKPTECSCWQ